MGINPGTRYLGLAVFQDTDLLDWRVKTFTGKWTIEKAGRILEIISEQIELYDINVMGIKKLHPSRSSSNLKILISKIKAVARRKRIEYESYSIKEIERVFLGGEKPNKRNLADRVVAEYPVLIHDLNKEKSRKHTYYMRAIEAVALGMMIKNAIDS
jgi:Holliday junction resolvasome RuvABC endonuclease subunit